MFSTSEKQYIYYTPKSSNELENSTDDERRSQTLVRGSSSPLTHSTTGYESILVGTTLHKERHDHEMSCCKTKNKKIQELKTVYFVKAVSLYTILITSQKNYPRYFAVCEEICCHPARA